LYFVDVLFEGYATAHVDVAADGATAAAGWDETQTIISG
jgi:hypothetical protein